MVSLHVLLRSLVLGWRSRFKVDDCTVHTLPAGRKFLTIVISVVRFGHPMSVLQWGGVTFVFGGLIMEAVHKYQVQRDRAKPKTA